MFAKSIDGPLKVLLKRFDDRPPRVHVQRWKRDHPVTIALSLEEFAVLCSTCELIEDQVRIAPTSGAPGMVSTLDVESMLPEGVGE